MWILNQNWNLYNWNLNLLVCKSIWNLKFLICTTKFNTWPLNQWLVREYGIIWIIEILNWLELKWKLGENLETRTCISELWMINLENCWNRSEMKISLNANLLNLLLSLKKNEPVAYCWNCWKRMNLVPIVEKNIYCILLKKNEESC